VAKLRAETSWCLCVNRVRWVATKG